MSPLEQREAMVAHQLERRGIRDQRVLEAMRAIPRERFVLPQDRNQAYEDFPLPIGFGQTISQPYIVAFMLEALHLRPTDRLLEIGTGSGYAAAIASELVKNVYTLEVLPELYERTSALFPKLHIKNVVGYLRDGFQGLPEEQPFDKIMLTAAPEHIPQTLRDQLVLGGLLISPVGRIRLFQRLVLIEKRGPEDFREEELMGVSFVEMIRGA